MPASVRTSSFMDRNNWLMPVMSSSAAVATDSPRWSVHRRARSPARGTGRLSSNASRSAARDNHAARHAISGAACVRSEDAARRGFPEDFDALGGERRKTRASRLRSTDRDWSLALDAL